MVTNLPANAGDIRDAGSTPGLGRSPGTNHLVLTDIYRMLYQMTTDYMFFHIYHNT